MKLLIVVILGVLLVTFAWGWFVHVQEGYMTSDRYVAYYLKAARDLCQSAVDQVKQWTKWFKKPLYRKEGQWP